MSFAVHTSDVPAYSPEDSRGTCMLHYEGNPGTSLCASFKQTAISRFSLIKIYHESKFFVRNLGELDNLLNERPHHNCLLNQANSMHENGWNEMDHCGLSWSGPFVTSTFSVSTQNAAVSLLTAILADIESTMSEPTITPSNSPTLAPSLSCSPTLDPSELSPSLVPSNMDTSEPSITPTSKSLTLTPPASLSPTSAPSHSLMTGGADPTVSLFDPSEMMATSGSGRTVSHRATLTLAVALSVGTALFLHFGSAQQGANQCKPMWSCFELI